jgi:hypothetical protein
MSYLDTGKDRFTWIPSPATASTRPELGCAQCGNRLDQPEFGSFNLTGKCLNCTSFVSDEDEIVDDLED